MSAPGPNALQELLQRLVTDPAVPAERRGAFKRYLAGDRSADLADGACTMWRNRGPADDGARAASGWACGAIYADLTGAHSSRDGYTRWALDELEDDPIDGGKTQETMAVWWETDAAGQPGGRS